MELIARFEHVQTQSESSDPFAGLSIEDCLRKHIVLGSKKNLDQHITAALAVHPPLDIINNILLDGMKEVGELFGAGKMQLPFVLQSAEVMKAAVSLLEPHMEKSEANNKGKLLLATVQGDVHDIGKNLVDIILSNNGYQVVNIGIKQPVQSILEAAVEHNVDAIGLSGLLVKSTAIMRENLLEMNRRNLSHFPVLLGGAALTRAYVEQDCRAAYDGQVFYAQDAFEGLRLMEEIRSGTSEAPVMPAQRTTSHRLPDSDPDLYTFDGTKSSVAVVTPPALPFYGSRKWTKFDPFEVAKYLNPVSLFRGQWQYKRPEGMGQPEFNAMLEAEARPILDRLLRELSRHLDFRVTWGYYPCSSEGNDLLIYAEDEREVRHRFRFPRQREGQRRCLADFFLPSDAPVRDVVGFQMVTIGSEVTRHERALFQKGDYQEYLYVHGFGVEMAEALAEYWHRQIRQEMKIDDQEPEDIKFMLSAKYHGARYSFGYPACPNLEDQAPLFGLLEPDQIGISLTEEFMLDPEQSTSAIVVHHPEAKYFNIR